MEVNRLHKTLTENMKWNREKVGRFISLEQWLGKPRVTKSLGSVIKDCGQKLEELDL